jgi:hypothetical protein
MDYYDEGHWHGNSADEPPSTSPDQSYNGDLEAQNDMLVDSDDFLNDADGDKDEADVAIINPDEALPRADDCMNIPHIQALTQPVANPGDS